MAGPLTEEAQTIAEYDADADQTDFQDALFDIGGEAAALRFMNLARDTEHFSAREFDGRIRSDRGMTGKDAYDIDTQCFGLNEGNSTRSIVCKYIKSFMTTTDEHQHRCNTTDVRYWRINIEALIHFKFGRKSFLYGREADFLCALLYDPSRFAVT